MNNPANHDLTAAFLRHQDELRRFLARRTDCGDTAADLLQEVYLRIADELKLSPAMSSV